MEGPGTQGVFLESYPRSWHHGRYTFPHYDLLDYRCVGYGLCLLIFEQFRSLERGNVGTTVHVKRRLGRSGEVEWRLSQEITLNQMPLPKTKS